MNYLKIQLKKINIIYETINYEKNNINMVLHIYSISIIDDSIYLEHFVNACKYSRIELYEYILKNKYDVIKQKMRNLDISHFSKDTLLHLIKKR